MDAADVADENDTALLLLGLMYGDNMEWIDNADECAPPVEVEVKSDARRLP